MEKGFNNFSLISLIMNEKVQKLLSAMKDGKLEVIEPVIEFKEGVKYPELEKILGSREDAEEALMILNEVGLLTWDIVDNIAVCPQCSSHNLLLKTSCPSCGSFKIVRGAMIEHMKCGHIDFEEEFKGEAGLVCPRCRKPLNSLGVDYRTYSFLYRCISCGTVFQTPEAKYLCSRGHEFNNKDLTIRSVKAYRLNPEKRNLLEMVTVNFKDILQPLMEEGWKVESPTSILGMTGAKHDFAFASWSKYDSGGESKVPDLVGALYMSENGVGVTDVLAFWAKAVDVGSKHRMMMTMPKMSDEGRSLAKAYGIDVVEGKDAIELQAKARELVSRIIEDAKSGSAGGEGEEPSENISEKTDEPDQNEN